MWGTRLWRSLYLCARSAVSRENCAISRLVSVCALNESHCIQGSTGGQPQPTAFDLLLHCFNSLLCQSVVLEHAKHAGFHLAVHSTCFTCCNSVGICTVLQCYWKVLAYWHWYVKPCYLSSMGSSNVTSLKYTHPITLSLKGCRSLSLTISSFFPLQCGYCILPGLRTEPTQLIREILIK